MKKHDQRGFTLMELMVVIVIVAILAAVAVPLYINYVNDARRTEAKGAIGAIITAEQTYYQQKGTYVDDTIMANPSLSTTQKLNCDLTETLNNWDITISGANGNAFIAKATGKSNDTKGLTVTMNYSRATGAAWDPQ